MNASMSSPLKLFLLAIALILSACQPQKAGIPSPEPSPVATAAPIVEPSPVATTTPIAEPSPEATTTPIAEPSPVATTTPAPEPSPAVTSPTPAPTPVAAAPTTTGTKAEANPVFNPVLPSLKNQTQIPVILPKYVPASEGTTPVYATLETADPSHYSIILGFTENCNGGTACRLGTISAEPRTTETAPTGEPVSLANGITGYFTEATCGANCSDATVSWEQNGNVYTVGIKAGKQATLVEMANSAIAPQ